LQGSLGSQQRLLLFYSFLKFEFALVQLIYSANRNEQKKWHCFNWLIVKQIDKMATKNMQNSLDFTTEFRRQWF